MYTAAQGGIPGAPQRFLRGNVAIIPQDVANLHRLLPPGPTDPTLAVAVLFVGGDTVPSMDNIDKLGPLLVSKSRVTTLIRFLVEHNSLYSEAGFQFSDTNLHSVCSGFSGDCGVPSTVVVEHLPFEDSASRSMVSGYADRRVPPPERPNMQPVLEVVGFPSDSQSMVTHSTMKACALQWCKDHKPFVRVTSGDRLFPDRDPRMLSYAFPHIDPYGIGGFHNPLREASQKISFERQLRNMLSRVHGPFKRDPNLAYVGWNIIQKQEATETIRFAVKKESYETLCADLDELGDTISDMSDKWSDDVHRKPVTSAEKKAIRVLEKLKVIAHNLRGSNGHKVRMRNQIRALLKQCGCPALF
ncbi:hypothetical protein DENSPDRAFT_921632, partial [Dentipellis sp. KUC8613]